MRDLLSAAEILLNSVESQAARLLRGGRAFALHICFDYSGEKWYDKNEEKTMKLGV